MSNVLPTSINLLFSLKLRFRGLDNFLIKPTPPITGVGSIFFLLVHYKRYFPETTG